MTEEFERLEIEVTFCTPREDLLPEGATPIDVPLSGCKKIPGSIKMVAWADDEAT